MASSETEAARGLLNAAAVRERAHEMLDLALAGQVQGWRVDLDRLPDTARFAAGVIRDQYPDLKVPFHARWRHFVFQGRDLWAEMSARLDDADARARAAFDLAIVSVLLDAGSGPGWRYRDAPLGIEATRSEGLALASLRMFEAGAFSDRDDQPLRADAAGLIELSAAALAEGFQVADDNPLAGLEGRASLLNRLGAQAVARPDLFAMADSPRPGGLYDAIRKCSVDGRLAAPVILEVLLEALGPVWQDRLTLGGVDLGDTWRHPALKRDDATDGLVPIHKLSQWLSYSLVEPLMDAGLEVTDLDGLTGLAEYRNGGLFLDMGVVALTDPADGEKSWPVSDPMIVAWRSMTVALLDRIAPLVRDELGVTPDEMPLASVLEGGTWAAGRRIAATKREGGGPPLTILSDGTVF
ncbi:DUF1688 family protein [Brevundimonas aveniformis]|uniref:DUF1688 family protein n=1 Tax=Brevundimonas aveniformis TaxID=370977 RepID=UPI00040DDC32|nr:DUF1688 family protein [Brevundimonas aveniformis]